MEEVQPTTVLAEQLADYESAEMIVLVNTNSYLGNRPSVTVEPHFNLSAVNGCQGTVLATVLGPPTGM